MHNLCFVHAVCVCVCVCVRVHTCMQQSRQSPTVVSFCRFPFLLDPQAKSLLIHVESRVQMTVSLYCMCMYLEGCCTVYTGGGGGGGGIDYM